MKQFSYSRVSLLARFTPIFALATYFLVQQYRWDPDPHHDGVMFAGAIAASDGLFPNRDFFAQYGPSAPIIQGIGLRLMGNTLINLRILSVVFLVLTMALINLRMSSKFGTLVPSLLTLIWSLTGPMGLPWSTIFSTFLIVLFLFLSTKISDDRVVIQYFRIPYLNGLLFIAAFTRIQVVLIPIILTLLFICFRQSLPKGFVKRWLQSIFLFVSLFLIFLNLTGILGPYVTQCVVWAFKYYSTPSLTLTYLSGLIWFIFVPGIFFLLQRWIGVRNKTLRFLGVSVLALSPVAATLIVHIFQPDRNSLFDQKYFVLELAKRYILSFDYFFIVMFLVVTGIFLMKERSERNFDFSYLFLSVIGLASLAQLYPLFDPYHLWMVSPIFLFLTLMMKINHSIRLKADGITSAFLVIFIGVLILNFQTNLNNQSFNFKSNILVGMSAARKDANAIDQTLLKLQNESSGIKFFCTDGLYAAANGSYMNVDEMFVDWGIEGNLSPLKYKRIFVCDYTSKQINSIRSSGFVDVFQIESGHHNGESETLFNALLRREYQ